MGKSLFTFLIILFGVTTLQSQNWQTFSSNKDVFFITQLSPIYTGQIQAFQADSTELVNNDSLFYLFKTFKDTFGLCIYDNRASWLGDKILIKANGENVFFNERNDSIKINTLAQLNDSFPIYNYQNGDVITALVTTISKGIVLGTPDSLKDFTLQVTDAFGNSISNYFNDQKFSIGKNSGIISTFSWREFPYGQDTLQNLISNYHRVTYADIYDYNVGDVFQTHGNSIQPTSPGVYANYEIISKWYSAAMDTVFYGEAVTIKDYTFTWIPTPHLDSTITFVSDTIFYTNLSSYLFNGKYPNQVIRDTNLTYYGGLTDYSMYADSTQFNGRVNLSNRLMNCTWNGSCFEPPFEINEQTFGYIVGCGSFEMEYYNTTTGAAEGGEIKLIYFKKGTEIYGTPQFISGVEELQSNIIQLSLYPNPSISYVNVHYNLGSSDKGILQLLDVKGRIVYKQKIYSSSKDYILNIGTYDNGLYEVRVIDDIGKYGSVKFIIQH